MASPYDLYNYIDYWKGRSFEDNCERLAIEKFFKKIDKKNSIADIGGGFGRLSTSYVRVFDKCYLIDPSEKNLDQARKTFGKNDNLTFIRGSLPDLPLISDSVEVALLIRVIHHLNDPLPSLKDTKRILTKDGYFILEVANKIHFLARLKAWLRGDFLFSRNMEPLERRSEQSIKENKITFINHHPLKVVKDLEDLNFEIVEILSVSNFRNGILKKIIPQNILLSLENLVQKPLAKSFFGPSIFILARK